MHPICEERLRRQHLLSATSKDPVAVLQTLLAIQAQDYAGAKWALGQRTVESNESQIEKALTDGRILRLHLMRPTWHFVSAEDINWLVCLTGPRVNAVSGYNYRKVELDEKVFRRTNKALTKALSGGRQLTRAELREVVSKIGIDPGDSTRFGHILLRAELDGLICSGARKGNQFTYALLADRAPRSRILERDEALGELALRYFSTRGPATVSDFVWWSGLTVGDVKRGIDVCGKLKNICIDDTRYWCSADKPLAKQRIVNRVHLLPSYDEYFIAYKDRSLAIDPKLVHKKPDTSFVFDAPMVRDGKVVGGWQRRFGQKSVSIKIDPLVHLTRIDQKDFAAAAQQYAQFLGKDLELL